MDEIIIGPLDWQNPDFGHVPRGPHIWRRYISSEVAGMWHTFTDLQKQALARQAQDIADEEHWD